jgi:hypothetical protein
MGSGDGWLGHMWRHVPATALDVDRSVISVPQRRAGAIMDRCINACELELVSMSMPARYLTSDRQLCSLLSEC